MLFKGKTRVCFYLITSSAIGIHRAFWLSSLAYNCTWRQSATCVGNSMTTISRGTNNRLLVSLLTKENKNRAFLKPRDNKKCTCLTCRCK